MFCATNFTVGGTFGTNNSVFILDGGKIFAGNGQQSRISEGSGGTNSLMAVAGTGSMFTNGGNIFHVGIAGFNHNLVISNGGLVLNLSSIIGNGAGTTGSQVLVSGPGSVWSNNGSVAVGAGGNNHSLIISNGGNVSATSFIRVGSTVSGSNNLIKVIGQDSFLFTASSLAVGTNSTSRAFGGSILILDQGTVQASVV